MATPTFTETIWLLETSLDDCDPQVIGYVLERAFELGALDAYAVPAQMKKFRPGVVLTLLARPAEREVLLALLLAETSTLGVRVNPCERVVLDRAVVMVDTAFGPIAMKVAGDKAHPEFDDCRAAAGRLGVPLRQVQLAALRAWEATRAS